MSHMRVIHLVGAGVVLAAAVSCSSAHDIAAPRAATAPDYIVNGSPTGSSYGSVGALLYDFNGDGILNGDDELCTGSLIAPTVFLTAAHCVVDPSTPPGSQFYVSFSPDLYAKNVKVIKAVTYTSDPGYGHDEANQHDEAVIILPS